MCLQKEELTKKTRSTKPAKAPKPANFDGNDENLLASRDAALHFELLPASASFCAPYGSGQLGSGPGVNHPTASSSSAAAPHLDASHRDDDDSAQEPEKDEEWGSQPSSPVQEEQKKEESEDDTRETFRTSREFMDFTQASLYFSLFMTTFPTDNSFDQEEWEREYYGTTEVTAENKPFRQFCVLMGPYAIECGRVHSSWPSDKEHRETLYNRIRSFISAPYFLNDEIVGKPLVRAKVAEELHGEWDAALATISSKSKLAREQRRLLMISVLLAQCRYLKFPKADLD